jgi:hypothetical protein
VTVSGGAQSVIDARDDDAGGFLIGLHNTNPFIFLGLHASLGKTTNVEPETNSSLGKLAFEAVQGARFLDGILFARRWY